MMRVKAMEVRNNIIQNNYGWKSSLEPFWKWMNFIGMTTSKAEDISYFSSIHRWVTYLLVLFLHPSIFIHMICNTESIVSTYTKGEHSSALHWNFLIDAFNFAIYVMGVHMPFIFTMIGRGYWKCLIDSIDLIEINLPNTQVRQYCIHISPPDWFWILPVIIVFLLLVGRIIKFLSC